MRLEPLAVRHAEDLAAAAEEDRGSYDLTLVPRGSEVGGYLAAQFARAARGLVPFAQVRRGDGRAVGCTAYWDPRYCPAGMIFALSRSALPGLPPRRGARGSTPRPSCY